MVAQSMCCQKGKWVTHRRDEQLTTGALGNMVLTSLQK